MHEAMLFSTQNIHLEKSSQLQINIVMSLDFP